MTVSVTFPERNHSRGSPQYCHLGSGSPLRRRRPAKEAEPRSVANTGSADRPCQTVDRRLAAARKAVVQKDPVAEAVEDKAEIIS